MSRLTCWNNTQYGSYSSSYDVGEFPDMDKPPALFADRMSSFKLQPWTRVTFYQNKNFGGASVLFEAGPQVLAEPDLKYFTYNNSTRLINDDVSSLKVVALPNKIAIAAQAAADLLAQQEQANAAAAASAQQQQLAVQIQQRQAAAAAQQQKDISATLKPPPPPKNSSISAPFQNSTAPGPATISAPPPASSTAPGPTTTSAPPPSSAPSGTATTSAPAPPSSTASGSTATGSSGSTTPELLSSTAIYVILAVLLLAAGAIYWTKTREKK